jgi:beta-phosphoglucomutase
MIKEVILDFDGVIVDSEPVRYRAYQELFRKRYSITISPTPDKKIVGRTEKENMKYLLDKYGLKGDIGELIAEKHKILEHLFSIKDNIQVLPGLRRLLNRLRGVGCTLVIVSSSPRNYVVQILKLIKADGFFDLHNSMFAVDKSKSGFYDSLFKKLGIEPKECIVIEDSITGIAAAKAAGIKTIGLTTTYNREELNQADFVFSQPGDIGISLFD